MINKIVVSYLNENKRLVIPGFGAFLRKDVSDVVFVEFLKKDDGVLSELLCKEFGVELDEAVSMISNYIAVINRQLHSTGRFMIEGLGELELNSNGVCDLVYDPTKRETLASRIDLIADPKIEDKIEVKTEPKTVADIVSEVAKKIGDVDAAQAVAQATVAGMDAVSATPNAVRPIVAKIKKVEPVAVKPIVSVLHHTEKSRQSQQSNPQLQIPQLQQTPAQSQFKSQPHQDPLKPTVSAAPAYRVVADAKDWNKRSDVAGGGYVVKRKAKMDSVMIIAIAVAVFAILALIYGMFIQNESSRNLLDGTPVEQEVVDVPQTVDNQK